MQKKTDKRNKRKPREKLVYLLLFEVLVSMIGSESFVFSAADNIDNSIKRELYVEELLKEKPSDRVALNATIAEEEEEEAQIVLDENISEPTDQNSSGALTPSKGMIYFNGHRETYYSQRVLPGNGLRIPGRYVAPDGTIRDEDNYICVASSDLSRGTIVETSLGTGKVYDSGCASGTIDIYTDW